MSVKIQTFPRLVVSHDWLANLPVLARRKSTGNIYMIIQKQERFYTSFCFVNGRITEWSLNENDVQNDFEKFDGTLVLKNEDQL